MSEAILTQRKIVTIARIGEIATIIGFLVFAALFLYVAYIFIANGAKVDGEISNEFLKEGASANFTTPQRLIGIVLLLLSDIVGFFGVYAAHDLFVGYKRGDIFTKSAATKLKTIGWVVVLLAPVSQLTETIGIFYFTRVVDPSKININVSLEDTHVYSIIFGLLIVIVGHVMYEAVRINEENKSFV